MNGAVDFPLGQADLAFTASGGAHVRRSVLPSGIRVLSEKVPGARTATIGYWVAAGSRDETGAGGTRGVQASYGSTHFLEHLLFKGTHRRTALDIAVAFDAVGGEHNALTAKEFTCYYAKVLDRDLPMAVEVIADMLTSSMLDEHEFETERGVILEELSMAEDDPADVVNERFFAAVLGTHPLGRPVGGSPEDIRGARRDAVWRHYRGNYRPQDVVVTAAGNLEHDALVSGVEHAVAAAGWDLGAAQAPVPRRSTVAAETGPGTTTVVRRPLEQANLIVGVPGLTASDRRRFAMAVLNAVLGGGMSSRLFQEVREKRGLAYAVYSFSSAFSDAGVFGLYAGCAPKRAGEVARLMLDELRRLAEDGITDTELQRAVGQLSGSAALALEDSDTRMSRLGRAELTMGRFADLDENLRRLAEVTPADVRSLAADLAARPVSLAAVGPLDDDFAALQ